MSKIIIIICFISFLGCTKTYENSLDGKIIYVSGPSKIYIKDLRNNLSEVINMADPDIFADGILHIKKINDTEVIFTRGSINMSVWRFDLEKKRKTFLLQGENPSIVKFEQDLVFYSTENMQNSGKANLYYSILDSVDNKVLVNTFDPKVYYAEKEYYKSFPTVVKISEDEVIFRNSELNNLIVYNIKKAKSKTLEIRDFVPRCFDIKKNVLFGHNVKSEFLEAVNLTNKKRKNYELKTDESFLLLEQMNSIIYYEPKLNLIKGESGDLYLLDLDKEHKIKISSDIIFTDLVFVK